MNNLWVDVGVIVAREINRLSQKAVANKRRPGYHADGGGLYLQVSPTGSKSWVFRFMLAGKAREMGLGPLHIVSLAEARTKAADCRKLLLARVDPIEARNAEAASKALDAARSITFAKCGEAYIKAHKAGWKNAKHVDQWTNTLETYCGPIVGSLPVQAVDTSLVLKVLEPIWTEKPETASRLRARIEKVLNWATVSSYRSSDNPARWRGHLDKLLPKLEKRKRVKHHPALPFDEIGAFMQSLRAQEGTAARALEFTVLTAGRTGKVIGAKWDEIDLNAALWTIPAARMKAHREHRVSAIHAGREAAAGPSGEAPRGLRVSRTERGYAAFQHGDAGTAQAHGPDRPDGTRLPLDIQGLGIGAHELPARGLRNGAGAYRERSDRGRVSPWRSVREAAPAHGGVGEALRQHKAHRQGDFAGASPSLK